MKSINIKSTIMVILISSLSIGFSACSGDSGDKISIEITTVCKDGTSMSEYQSLQSADIISRTETLHIENNISNVKIYHNQNNEKSVCVKSGIAYIIR